MTAVKSVESPQWRNIKPVAVVFIALFMGVQYWSPELVWDDAEIFSHLYQTSFVQLWFEPVTGGRLGAGYYRPVAMSLLKLCSEPYKAHILISIFHALSALAIYRLVPDAFSMACLFAIHPLASEVLGWASALPDAGALCLGLWGVYAAQSSKWRLVFVLVFCGSLCKETAWVPLLGFLLSQKQSWTSHRTGWFFLFGILGMAIGLRIWAGAVGGEWSLWGRVASVPIAVMWSIGSLVWPFPLSAIHDIHALPASRLMLGGYCLIFCGLGCFKRAYRASSITILLSIFLAVPTMIDGGLFAERYVYMASAGLCWGLGTLFHGDKTLLSHLGSTVLIVVMFLMGARIHTDRSQDWLSDRLLFESAAAAFPRSSYAHHFVGMVAIRESRMGMAAAAFEKALVAPYAHKDDAQLFLITLVESGQFERAFMMAQAGPKEGLSSLYIAYWAKSAFHVGEYEKSKELLKILCDARPTCDGPDWVQEMYVTDRQ